MSALNEKQADFAYYVAMLLVRARDELGIRCVGAEWHRPDALAELYASQGKGIANSLHRLKLALDVFVLDDNGSITFDLAAYEPLGAQWKSMHPLARWGGDFKSKDSVHFSFEHEGVK